jgi:hypothetical protein
MPPHSRREDMRKSMIAHQNAARHLRCWADKPSDWDAALRAAAALDALPGDHMIDDKPSLARDPEAMTGDAVREAAAKFQEGDGDPSGDQQRLAYTATPPLDFAFWEWVRAGASEQERVARDIEAWLEEYKAKGGANLAAQALAQLVADFFLAARTAASDVAGGAPPRNFPRVKFASADNHTPRNPYCRTVEAAIMTLGMPSERWRHAAKKACDLISV